MSVSGSLKSLNPYTQMTANLYEEYYEETKTNRTKLKKKILKYLSTTRFIMNTATKVPISFIVTLCMAANVSVCINYDNVSSVFVLPEKKQFVGS